jgi:hypothetical protein
MGCVKSNSATKSILTALDAPGDDCIWRIIKGKDVVEYHIVDRKMRSSHTPAKHLSDTATTASNASIQETHQWQMIFLKAISHTMHPAIWQ